MAAETLACELRDTDFAAPAKISADDRTDAILHSTYVVNGAGMVVMDAEPDRLAPLAPPAPLGLRGVLVVRRAVASIPWRGVLTCPRASVRGRSRFQGRHSQERCSSSRGGSEFEAGAGGSKDTATEALHSLFAEAGLQSVEVREIEIAPTYSSFDEFWTTQTASVSPTAKFIGSLTEPERLRLRNAVRSALPSNTDGSVTYPACAHAVRARAPE